MASMSNERHASDAQKSAIDALQKFYALIVAFAFTRGLLKLLEDFNIESWSAEQFSKTILFVAFVVTIVPFYHGMERHLYDSHISRDGINWSKGGKPSRILFDIFSFMIMAGLLLAMGLQIDSPISFFKLWAALLIWDIIWSLVVWQRQKGEHPLWALNNSTWLIMAALLWLGVGVAFERFALDPIMIAPAKTAVIAFSEIARSICDYKFYGDFYFPDQATAKDTKVRPNLIYLAGPYSNDAPENPNENASDEKRLARFNAVTEVAKKLVENEELLYSPLTMTHPIDIRMNSKPDSAFWVEYDEAFMEHCSEIRVLKLPGYDQSSGVNREVEFFKKRGIQATYLEPNEYGITPAITEFKAAFD